MGTIGSRLRQERDRLGLNQSDLAELGGSTRKSQFNYESDARRPDADYLARIAAAGLNVLYILTGNVHGVEPVHITAEERELLALFRNAPTAVRKAAVGALMSAAGGSVRHESRGAESGAPDVGAVRSKSRRAK